MTRYERTKAFRKSHPAYRKRERAKYYAKYAYGEPHRNCRYATADIMLILTKQYQRKVVQDHYVAKQLQRSLKAIHVYRSLLLSTRVPEKWKILVHCLQKEGRVWQKQ